MKKMNNNLLNLRLRWLLSSSSSAETRAEIKTHSKTIVNNFIMICMITLFLPLAYY